MSNDFEPCGNNDLRVRVGPSGGFIFVELYDADDHDHIVLQEDDIIALKKWLDQVVAEHFPNV